MNAIRLAAPARATLLRATPAVGRYYSPDGRQEGATATSQGFRQAEEGQYIKKREAEQLKQAKEKLAAAQKEVDDLQKKASEKK